MGYDAGSDFIPAQECFFAKNGAVAGNGTLYSRKFNIQTCGAPSFQVFNNGVTVAWTAQVSNKPDPNEANDADWTDLVLTPTPTTYFGLGGLEGKWTRMKGVVSAGTGSTEVYACGKPAT